MSYRDAWRTPARQALLVQLSSASPCRLLSQPVGWWGCSGSQPQARAHCGEAGGRHGQSRQQASRSGGSCHREALGKQHRRLRKVCNYRSGDIQDAWCKASVTCTQTANSSKRKTLRFVSCFNTKAFCEQGHLWYWKNAFLCILYPTNSLLRNQSLFYRCVLLIKGIAPVSHLVCFTDSHPWFLNQETRICN